MVGPQLNSALDPAVPCWFHQDHHHCHSHRPIHQHHRHHRQLQHHHSYLVELLLGEPLVLPGELLAGQAAAKLLLQIISRPRNMIAMIAMIFSNIMMIQIMIINTRS